MTSANLAYEKVQFLSADTYFYGTKAGTGFPLEGKYISPDKIVIGTFDGENSSSLPKLGPLGMLVGRLTKENIKQVFLIIKVCIIVMDG